MQSPQIRVENKMTTEKTGIRSLVGKRMSKKVKFMGGEITINKLTVSQVIEIQNLVKERAETPNDDGFDLLKTVIKMSTEGGADMEDSEFSEFPMDELSNLSSEIMKFSGIQGDQGKG